MRGNKRRPDGATAKDGLKKRFTIRRRPTVPGHSSRRTKKSLSVRDHVPASYLVVICLVVAAVTAAFVFHLHIRFEGVKLGYETSRSRAERARLIIERRELRLELASLKAPGRVESEARDKLGMEIPDHRRIIPIGKKRKTTLASGGAR
ncbi:MAG: cell division protein FtsL [Deltaproteobacteria bacterium]|nr:cell division protein FtsL [Deltaproteobacteria bacterium]